MVTRELPEPEFFRPVPALVFGMSSAWQLLAMSHLMLETDLRFLRRALEACAARSILKSSSKLTKPLSGPKLIEIGRRWL